MTYYGVGWDSRVYCWTIFTLSVLTGSLVLLIRFSIWGSSRKIAIAIAVAVIMLASTAVFAPRGYDLRDDVLVVKTYLWRFSYDLKQLSAASPAAADEVFSRGTVRVVGVGGLFGYFGFFRNPRLGTFTAFVTHLDELVVLRFQDRTLVISPRNRTAFLQQIRRS